MAVNEYLATAFGVTGAIWTIIQWIIVVTIIGVIIGVVVMFLRYNIKVRVREIIGGKTRIIDERAREVKDNEGVLKWKLLWRKHNLPIPPPEAIHLTNKGKYSVEAYYLPEGEYKYVMDNGVNIEKLSNFEPLDTSDREFYASEMREAEEYRQKSWKDYILPIAGLMTILAVLIVMLVFWEDIAKPGIQIVERGAGISQQQHETVIILRDILQNRQQIEMQDIPESSSGDG